jgi:hypothetical protein
LAYIAAALVGLWGVAHAVPTRRVVAGFEPLTVDNRRVLAQEWLAEAFTMWGLAALVVVVTACASSTTHGAVAKPRGHRTGGHNRAGHESLRPS